MASCRNQLAEVLSDINRQIAKAEQLTVARGDDDTLQRASKVLSELKEQRHVVEGKLRGNNG